MPPWSTGDLNKRKIKKGQTRTLKFEFDKDNRLNGSNLPIRFENTSTQNEIAFAIVNAIADSGIQSVVDGGTANPPRLHLARTGEPLPVDRRDPDQPVVAVSTNVEGVGEFVTRPGHLGEFLVRPEEGPAKMVGILGLDLANLELAH